MPLDELTLTLSDPDGRVSVETLTKALEDALDMLRSVSSDIVASGVHVRWDVIRVRMRSPLQLTIAPRIRGKSGRAIGRKVVKACLRGVTEIEKSPVMPAHFNEEALDATKRLARRHEGVSLSFSSSGKDKVTLTEKTVQHVEEIASKSRLYMDFSTIEGYLEVVSVHEHQSFFVWETLTNRKVECFATEEQFDQATSRLKKRPRIAVTGRVHYRNHVPKTIDVESVRFLRDANELPQPGDIGPINITEGLTSEDHVRRIRNG